MDCNPPDSFVPGISQARILECVAIPFSRESSPPRDQTLVSCIGARFFTIWATREAKQLEDEGRSHGIEREHQILHVNSAQISDWFLNYTCLGQTHRSLVRLKELNLFQLWPSTGGQSFEFKVSQVNSLLNLSRKQYSQKKHKRFHSLQLTYYDVPDTSENYWINKKMWPLVKRKSNRWKLILRRCRCWS